MDVRSHVCASETKDSCIRMIVIYVRACVCEREGESEKEWMEAEACETRTRG